MGWGAHPDTISCAMAEGLAQQQGHKPNTLEFLQAYRDNYASRATPGERGLDNYLSQLDASIASYNSLPKRIDRGVGIITRRRRPLPY